MIKKSILESWNFDTPGYQTGSGWLSKKLDKQILTFILVYLDSYTSLYEQIVAEIENITESHIQLVDFIQFHWDWKEFRIKISTLHLKRTDLEMIRCNRWLLVTNEKGFRGLDRHIESIWNKKDSTKLLCYVITKYLPHIPDLIAIVISSDNWRKIFHSLAY